jgi:hypothetical protein
MRNELCIIDSITQYEFKSRKNLVYPLQKANFNKRRSKNKKMIWNDRLAKTKRIMEARIKVDVLLKSLNFKISFRMLKIL